MCTTRLLRALVPPAAIVAGMLLARAVPTVGGSPLSVQSIYTRLQATLVSSGAPLHIVATERDLINTRAAPQKEQVWVDGPHDVARQSTAVSMAGRAEVEDTFYLRDVTVSTWRDPSQGWRRVFTLAGQFSACHGAGLVASLLIGCPLYLNHDPIGDVNQNLDRYSETAATATYGGRPAVLLQVRGTITNADGTFRSTGRLYLDPKTMLPIARRTTTTSGGGVHKELATFAVTPVKSGTLGRGFFDPASLGYPGADAVMRGDLAQMPAAFPVYWLGMHWKGTKDLGPVAVSFAGKGLPNELNITYAPEGNRFGDGVVHLYEVEGGNNSLTRPPSGPCYTRQQVALSGGSAIVSVPGTGSSCTGSESLSALATFGKLKILIDAVVRFAGAQVRAGYGAYNTAAGLTAVLKALVHR